MSKEVSKINAELLGLCKRALAIEESVTQGQERELRAGFVNDLRFGIQKAEAGSAEYRFENGQSFQDTTRRDDLIRFNDKDPKNADVLGG